MDCGLRPVTTTLAPSLMNRPVAARPIPLVPPGMTTILFVKRAMISLRTPGPRTLGPVSKTGRCLRNALGRRLLRGPADRGIRSTRVRHRSLGVDGTTGFPLEPMRPHGLVVKGLHLLGDVGQRNFDREVTGLQPMNLRLGKVLEIGLTALTREENVVLSPEYDRLGLLLSEEGLPLRIEFDVRPIVIEQVELDPSRVWPVEIVQIHVPIVRADELWSGVAVGVDQLDSVGLQEGFERLLGLGRPALPVGATQAVPHCSEPDLVGVGVLNDQ